MLDQACHEMRNTCSKAMQQAEVLCLMPTASSNHYQNMHMASQEAA